MRVRRAIVDAIRRAAEPNRVPPPEAFGSFGARSVIEPPAVILTPARIHIGSDTLIRSRSSLSVVEEYLGQTFAPTLRIGDRTKIGTDLIVSCTGEVTIGSEVMMSGRVFIGDAYHDYRDPETSILRQPMTEARPVSIGDGAFLGVGAIVLPGVTIGARSYVAAGAVVTRDVPPNTVVGGNPAEVLRQWDGERGWV